MPDCEVQSVTTEYSAKSIYNEYSDFIRVAIKFHISDENHAEDIFQDFFLHLVTYPPPHDLRNVKAFLYRSITNFIATTERRRKDYRTHLCRFAEQKPKRHMHTPEKRLINAEEAQRVFALIETLLPQRESAAITERYKNDCEIHEVAQKLGVNSRSVSRYVSSGLRKIHKLLLVGQGD